MKICLSCEGVTDTSAQRCGNCSAWLLPTDAVHYPTRRGETESGNPLLGTVVDGKYRLQSVLGRGGLGTVFRAQHIGSLMTVALKLLHPRFAERPEYRRALLPEARRAATVTHERCARLLDVGEADEGAAYLAMEMVDGRTLDMVARSGAMAPGHAVAVLVQIAEALVAIHAAGLVHCDLSPRNVMVAFRAGQLRVKVLDFGIARSVSLAGDRGRSEFAGFVNPAFSAPELLAGRDVDPRADLYSLGTLAWLLLTGSMPVDDTDARRAALAVAAGELRPWPKTPGVPARLARLVQRCLAMDPGSRPASALEVLQELAIVQGARRPLVARIAVAVMALAVLANFGLAGTDAPPFLQLLSGSDLVLRERALDATQPAQDLTSQRLETLVFHYGGFAGRQLRADVARQGVVLLRAPLRPELDPRAGTLLLSSAQADWRQVVQGLARISRDGPVDLAFVVPGRAPLGNARLRVDDDAPELAVHWLDESEHLRGTSRLQIDCSDAVAVDRIDVLVRLQSGATYELVVPPRAGPYALGAALAARVGAAAMGPGELVVRARDRAGNERMAAALPFASADVAAPAVVAVTGPSGESFLPAVGDSLRLRLQMAAAEAGSTVAVQLGDAAPVVMPLPAVGLQHNLEVPRSQREAFAPLSITVVDAAGNRAEFAATLAVRDRTLLPTFAAITGGARWLAGELVVEADDVVVETAFGPNWRLQGVRIDAVAGGVERLPDDAAAAGGAIRLLLHDLPAGLHALVFDFADAANEDSLRVRHQVALRVLPPIEIRVPAPKARYLPGYLEAGVLARRGNGLVDGPGWRFDPQLRPYVRGALRVGVETPVRLPLPVGSASEALLPEVALVPGRNVFAVAMVDVLDRPVRVLVGDSSTQVDVIADFWWNDAAPEPIGEELLVEYGQPARLRLRCPLPFTAADAPELRLGIAQSELSASTVQPTRSDASVVTFEIPAAVWSVAAQLAGRAREEFANQLQASIEAHIATPAGRHGLSLRLRTTRSTLAPLRLQEFGDLDAALAGIVLLPVLAPRDAFAEPVPPDAPPRSSFRPQVAVAVRNMPDFLLQQTEFTVGMARALAGKLAGLPTASLAACVHHGDPLGAARMQVGNLLPSAVAFAADDAALVGVDFYQAYALARLCGLAVAGEPGMFRLPLGCELELAAFGGAVQAAANGVAAHGAELGSARFLAGAEAFRAGGGPTAADERATGDVVPTSFGLDFVGLDFGVCEWVFDLPHLAGVEMLLREWLADHAVHLGSVEGIAAGVPRPAPDPLGPLQQQLAVVRGLALGDRAGLVDAAAAPLDLVLHKVLPANVPGVLRTEQLRRDGSDLLAGARDARLPRTGFRLAATASAMLRLRGRR